VILTTGSPRLPLQSWAGARKATITPGRARIKHFKDRQTAFFTLTLDLFSFKEQNNVFFDALELSREETTLGVSRSLPGHAVESEYT
jgi:hypothetical protein